MKHSRILVICLAAAATAASSQTNIVDLGYAQYQGEFNTTSNITSFFGIRYAAPPTGYFRWRAPRAPAFVQGVQPANTQPNECFQGGFGVAPTAPFLVNTTLRKRDVMQTEDCLFLNVFVPGNIAPNASLPVLVWIHGGGYSLGSAAGDGGDFIRDADGGVVSVVIQYRLGIFGFLSGAEVQKGGTLNAGLLDQRFALRWVQDHISRFGGDPSEVTIWGESAGAGSVLQHIVADGGRTNPPLFRAAMTSSTFLPSQYKYNDPIPEQVYADVVKMTNCTTSENTLSCLRAVDAETLGTVDINITQIGFFGTFVLVPVIDGKLIIERPVETLRTGNFNGDALLAVTNTFEGRIFVNSSTTLNINSYVSNLFPNFGQEQINAVVSQYTGVAGLSAPLDQAIAIMGESIFICPSYFLLEAFGARGFKGEFAVPPGNHILDVGQYFPSSSPPVTSNTTFIKSFSQSFLAVVKSLNPNAKFDPADITPQWPAWNPDFTEMLFNVTETGDALIHPITTDPDLRARCNFWQGVSPLTPQ